MILWTFCMCCHLKKKSSQKADIQCFLFYPKKWARLPANVCAQCVRAGLCVVVSTRSFFLTSPAITHTSGSTKIEQFQQRLLLQDKLMKTAGSNFTSDQGACGFDISGQACTMWMKSREWYWLSPFGISVPLRSLCICQHKALHGNLCTVLGWFLDKLWKNFSFIFCDNKGLVLFLYFPYVLSGNLE